MNEDKQVAAAVAIKQMRENMPAFMDLCKMDAEMKWCRYQAYLKAGFNVEQALDLVQFGQ